MRVRHFPWALGVICFITFVCALLRFDGPAKGYWDTYITAPAMFMNQQAVQFELQNGQPAFQPDLRGVLPDDLVDHDDFGIITKDQRIGGGITASTFFACFGQLGFRILFACTVFLVIPLTVLIVRALFPGRDWLGLFGGVVLAWNPYMLNVDRLNANGFAMPLMLLVLLLLVRREPRWLLLGLCFGLLAGIRNEAICFVPALIYWFLRPSAAKGFNAGSSGSFSARFWALFQVGFWTLIALSPVLYWKWYAFGHPLMHPSQYAHFQGFRPEFPHQFFGLSFTFNGLFNWPLHDHLVRTPHFGYPTYLLFPLVTVRALGTVITALCLCGVGVLWKQKRSVLWLLILWMAPVYLLFGPQENWEEVKMTFMLLAWPPIGVFAAAGGLPWLDPSSRRRAIQTTVGLAVLVMVGVKLLGTVHAPQDERWYIRFPKAAETDPGAQPGLAEAQRNDWTYFQSYETEEEIARERHKLTRALPWPARYLPLEWDFSREWGEMVQESGTRELRILEIWGYIYDQDKRFVEEQAN